MAALVRVPQLATVVRAAVGILLLGLGLPALSAEGTAQEVLKSAGLDAGLCVHLGCGQAKTVALTADLAAGSRLLVHGLALDDASLARARQPIDAKGLNGRAMVERASVAPLPYLPDLANLVVIEDFDALAGAGLTMDEVNRVVAGRYSKTSWA